MLAVLRGIDFSLPSFLAPARPAPPHLRIDALHSDLVYLVAARLHVFDLLVLACVNKRLSELLSNDILWGAFFNSDLPWPRAQLGKHNSWKKVYIAWLRDTISKWRLSGKCIWPISLSSATPGREVPLKVALFGPPGAGKSSLMARISNDRFSSDYMRTIGVDFAIRLVHNVKLQIWDLAGDSRFKSIVKHYYGGTRVGVFVYDASSTKESAEAFLSDWFSDSRVRDNLTPLIIVRTKCDALAQPVSTLVPPQSELADKAFVMDYAKSRSFHFVFHYLGLFLTPAQDSAQAIHFIEASSATGAGISSIVDTVMSHAHDLPVIPKMLVTEEDVKERLPLLDAPWYKRVAYFY